MQNVLSAGEEAVLHGCCTRVTLGLSLAAVPLFPTPKGSCNPQLGPEALPTI